MDVLMLKPVFKDAIWGGKLLSDFGYKEAGDSAGECSQKWRLYSNEWGVCRKDSFMVLGKS